MEPIKFIMRYLPEDVDEYLYNGTRQIVKWYTVKKSRISLAVGWGIVVLMVLLVIGIGYSDTSRNLTLYIMLDVMVIMLQVGRTLGYFKRMRQFASMKQNVLRAESEVTIDERGLSRVRTDGSSYSGFAWSTVELVKVTPRLYMFFDSEFVLAALPKSSMTEKQIERLELYIDQYVKTNGASVHYMVVSSGPKAESE